MSTDDSYQDVMNDIQDGKIKQRKPTWMEQLEKQRLETFTLEEIIKACEGYRTMKTDKFLQRLQAQKK